MAWADWNAVAQPIGLTHLQHYGLIYEVFHLSRQLHFLFGAMAVLVSMVCREGCL